MIFFYLEHLLFLSDLSIFYQKIQTRNVRVGSLNSTSAQCYAVLPYVSWCLHCQNFCRMSITRLSLEVIGWGLHNALKDRRSGKESWAFVWFSGLARGQSCSVPGVKYGSTISTFVHWLVYIVFLSSCQVTPELSSQALSTLLHIQKFYAYVVDYYEMEQLEVRAEFNRILREQDRFVKLVNKVLVLFTTIH